jgi:hypothetical protein
VTPPSGNVPVGVASKTGYGVAAAGLIGALVAYLTGDHSQAQLGSIVGAAVGLISLAMTQIGRYVQANTLLKTNPQFGNLYAQGAAVLGTIEHYDPNALPQVDALVRKVVSEEIGKLPSGSRTLATDAESILLPTPEEEAAQQPPSLPSAGADAGALGSETQVSGGLAARGG